jgi:hypothetical protein
MPTSIRRFCAGGARWLWADPILTICPGTARSEILGFRFWEFWTGLNLRAIINLHLLSKLKPNAAPRRHHG